MSGMHKHVLPPLKKTKQKTLFFVVWVFVLLLGGLFVLLVFFVCFLRQRCTFLAILELSGPGWP